MQHQDAARFDTVQHSVQHAVWITIDAVIPSARPGRQFLVKRTQKGIEQRTSQSHRGAKKCWRPAGCGLDDFAGRFELAAKSCWREAGEQRGVREGMIL